MKNFRMNNSTIVACVGLILCAIAWSVDGVSVSCMMAYEGGAPAVFNSPECPQWFLSADISQNSTRNCQFATLQGRREYQEDRVTCNLDMKLPISGKDGPEEVTIGIAAIFDGHGGDEASEMASKRLLGYFSMHVVFNAYKQTLRANKENHETHTVKSFQGTLPMIDNLSLYLILEEALLKTIQDIDREFSKEAMNKGYVSGSTGIVLVLVNGQSLIANVGDSKALVCSQRIHSQHNAQGASVNKLYAEELTRDHHPDREDEKARIEAAGGFVRTLGVPRVNGILAVSRAIGDLSLKRYGVIAEPEITEWRHFIPDSNYWVVASDGIFETLTPQDVCDIVVHHNSLCEAMLSSSSLADCIVRIAFKTGSTDNLSVIVISNLLNTSE